MIEMSYFTSVSERQIQHFLEIQISRLLYFSPWKIAKHGRFLNGDHLNNIMYADRTVDFSDSLKSLQLLMNKVNEINERFGLEVNKTKLNLRSSAKIKLEAAYLEYTSGSSKTVLPIFEQ